MNSDKQPSAPAHEPAAAADPQTQQDEERVADKVPEEVTPAQEWGGRYQMGKTIATGGEGGSVAHADEPDEDAHSAESATDKA